MNRKRIWIGASAAALAILLFLGIWAFWWEPRRLIVREESLVISGWPPGNELRVALLSDLHVGSPHNQLTRLRSIVGRVNAKRVDAVFVLGDLVIQGVLGGQFVAPEAIANELQRLTSRAGTFAVLGNHDWWLNATRVATALRKAGVVVLEDSAVNVITENSNFWLAGVSDYWEGRHDVNAALQKIPFGASTIVITHNPDIFPAVPARVALTVAGHTHGGQVNLPLVGPPIVPSEFGQRYAKGHIIEQGRHLYVSSGTGTSILPVRFRVPPEIVILTVRGR